MKRGIGNLIVAVAVTFTFGAWGLDSTASAADTAAPTAAVDQNRLDHAASEPQNWLTYGGTYAEQRYSTLDQITTENVSRLGLAWSYPFDSNRGEEATPLVADGVMYTTSAWSKVYALDAATGRELWHYDPQVPGQSGISACCDVVNRGVALWKGSVFFGTIDGRLIALDAATGKLRWSVATTDRSKPYTITGAPRVFKDTVVIGNGGAEFPVRGYLTAYDTRTGRLKWRFYTVPGDPHKGRDHAASDYALAKAENGWSGDWYKYGGGGTVWDSIVYDPELDQLYFGTGNGGPWNRVIRSAGKGDNLFLGSIVAVKPETGRYLWHYQVNPGESWDFDATIPLMQATLTVNGGPRQVLMQASKNGFFYVIDRTNGKLLSAQSYAAQTWAKGIDLATGRPIFVDNAYYDHGQLNMLPASLGAHSWHPMSYSPRTGLVYIPTMQLPVAYSQPEKFNYRAGLQSLGTQIGLAPGTDLSKIWGALMAWDPVKQEQVWRVPQPEMWNGGTLATAGDLVFAGNAHGEFTAFKAQDGTKLWSFTQAASIMAGPVTYRAGGEQYVAVQAGYGGAGPLALKDFHRPQKAQPLGRVLVFKLGGTATLAPESLDLPPANPPADTFSPVQQKSGGELFQAICAVCHGGSVLPDLRRSGALADKTAWNQIVIGGALSPAGMVSFARWLTPGDAEAIRAYVAGEAAALQKH